VGPIINLRSVSGETWTNGNMIRLASKARHNQRILVAQIYSRETNLTLKNFNLRKVEDLPRQFTIAPLNEQINQFNGILTNPVVTIFCNDTKTSNSIVIPDSEVKNVSLLRFK